jgi:hypothetical protein
MISADAVLGSGLEAYVAAGLLIAVVAAPCAAVWLVARRVRRGIDRLSTAPAAAARRIASGDPRVERTLLRVRDRLAPPGPAQVAAGLKRDLAQAVAHTRASVAALPSGAPVGDLPHLLRRLERLAAPLDAELEHLRRDPDPALQAALLPGMRDRTGQLLEVAGRIRAGAALVRSAGIADVAADLDADARQEVEALRAGAGLG